MSDHEADVIVIGLGTGGEELAGRLAMAGLDVVGIEPALVGGECAYWACIPTKMAVRAANLLVEARRIDGVAGHAAVTPDWEPVATRIRDQAAGGWDDSYAVARFEGRGGRFVRGRGVLTGPRSVAVGALAFTARRGIVIATGSRPIVPPIPGLDGVPYWTSHEAISTPSLPSSLLVLGGGAVGCELGQVFARFGVEVTIVEAAERLLPGEEPEASVVVSAALAADGVRIRTGARAERVEPRDNAVAVTLDDGTELAAERLLVAVGRASNVSGLGLEAAGIAASGGAIPVDDRLRAGDGIWAIGDVTGKGMFSHVALYQAGIVVAAILGETVPPADYRSLPRATFTDPEVGSVGMTEATARKSGLDVAVVVKPVAATFRGWLHGTGNEGLIKLVADRTDGVLVGATSVGPHGAELLGMLALAVHQRVPLEDLRTMIYAFPTFHGGVGEAIGAYARALVQVLDPDAKLLLD
ncbi:MAG: NAD(P)/FAD-dependent oxidoreductase [Chloroflexi bacterium]|nr:NAD(P)/FAD-dependent oxidoreductase [Chloroflexota bacterium]